jgi:hypothetical protein
LVLTEFWGATSPSQTPTVGVGEQTIFPRKTPMLSCSFSGHSFAHQFLVMPQCPTPLLGRDILTKFRASISFNFYPIPLLALMARPALLIPLARLFPQGWTPRYGTLILPPWALVLPLRFSYRIPIAFRASLSTPSLLSACWDYNQSLMIYSKRGSSDLPTPHTMPPS